MLLPGPKLVTWLFLQQLLADLKSPTYYYEVKDLDIPPWPELSVDKFWVRACSIPEFTKRMPDEWLQNGGSRADRTWFWKSLYAVNPDLVDSIFESCTR